MVQSIQDNIVHDEKDLTLLCLSGVSEVEKKENAENLYRKK